MSMITPAPAPLPMQGPDFDRRSIEVARRELDDIAHCREAEFKVQWIPDAIGRKVPFLVLVFTAAWASGHPACSIGIAAISRSTGTLTLLDGDRLRAHLRRSVESYLRACGVVLDKPEILFNPELN